MRVDYRTSSEISAKYAGQNATVQTNPGTIPGYNDNVFQFPAILVPSATVNYTLNSSTVIEGTWGLTQGNQLGNVLSSPGTDPATVGLANFPRLYQNGLVPTGTYQEKVLQEMNASVLPERACRASRRASRGVDASRFAAESDLSDVPLHAEHEGPGGERHHAVGLPTFKVGYQSQDR